MGLFGPHPAIAERDAARRDTTRARAEFAAVKTTPTTDHLMRGLVKDRLLVFLRDGGGAFDGLLISADDRTLCFADVHQRAIGETATAAPGELYIERDRVAYAQRLAVDNPRD